MPYMHELITRLDSPANPLLTWSTTCFCRGRNAIATASGITKEFVLDDTLMIGILPQPDYLELPNTRIDIVEYQR